MRLVSVRSRVQASLEAFISVLFGVHFLFYFLDQKNNSTSSVLDTITSFLTNSNYNLY
jgi:K+-transporting ATPase A subunit